MAGEVDVVLDGERDAVEGQAVRAATLELRGALHERFARDPVDPDLVPAARGNPRRDAFDERARPQAAAAQPVAERPKIEAVA